MPIEVPGSTSAFLAQPADLGAWLDEPSMDETDARAVAVLRAASVLIRSYCNQDFADGVPDAVMQAAVQVAGRLYSATPGGPAFTQEQSGPFGFSQRFGGDGPYLTKAEKQILAPYRKGGLPVGLSTLATTRGEPYIEDQYVNVDGGSPMPFLPEDRTL